MDLTLTSTAYSEGDRIPDKYTCEGDDLSPPLSWAGAPAGTESFVLICDDPDAPVGTWDHWVIYNIPPGSSGLPEGTSTDAQRSDGSSQGLNSWGRTGYGGPCPPPGFPHRYFFKLYALDSKIEPRSEADKNAVEYAMEGHVLAQTNLMGTYSR